MLTDPVRLGAFRRAIEETVRPGDVVLDLGAGLGILSFLAVRAGAARVYAVEKDDCIDLAQKVAGDNGIADKIVFLKENSLNVELPELADVLVSETLGSFGVDENSLTFVADARERLLKQGARMIPERVRPWLVPVEIPGVNAIEEPWRDIEGFDFLGAIRETMDRMGMVSVEVHQMLAEPQALDWLDFRSALPELRKEELSFESRRAGIVDGLAGWFEVELCPGVSFATAPDAPETHWQQAFFPAECKLEVSLGQRLEALVLVEHGSALDESAISVDLRLRS